MSSNIPVIEFQSFQPITCEPVNITWSFSGADNAIDLSVTNNDVAQDIAAPPLTSSHTRRPNTFTNDRRAVPTGVSNPIPVVNAQIASGIEPTLQAYTWPLVNIPQGWYVFSANMPGYGGGYSTTSDPIFVHNGDDTSCLPSTSSSSSSSASSTGSSTTTNSPSPTTTVLPIIGASSHTSVGTIAGVSVAAVVLIGMVITAWLCLLRRGRKTSVLGGGQAASGRWNGLSSVDSRVLTNSGRPLSRHQGRGGTVGTIPGEAEDAIGAEKSSVYSKNPFETSGVALSALPVLQQQQTTRTKVASRTYSASSSSSNVFSANEYVAAPPGRRPSIQDSLGRQSLDSSNTYPPTSPVSPHARSSSQFMPSSNLSRSQSITSNTHQTSPSQSTASHAHMYQQSSSPSDPSSPVSPSSDATNLQTRRQSFGGKKRKPVPAYDPSQDPLSPSLAPSPIPPPSPSPDHIMNTSNAGGHYTTRNQAGRDSSQPQLVHKSSFGPGGVEGKPLHYLIPDMPMSLKD